MSRRNQVKSLTSSFYHQEELWHHFRFRLPALLSAVDVDLPRFGRHGVVREMVV
jgi:hypothetical protein